ncbi:PREDICTED: very-long-chain (3R)-3-hydroxyacyl-CoA dehydratase 2 [Bison bison bison]|uniref:Very-long-chain (3R)-3-hydroxyacyl-CoA dehydratase n=4 Tax=Boreoeutheria TaxID=1437010 RepID=A0A6P3H140_BISBB|nr:PREDICTED: very-long-chain (3R)-3-hydroxyacyl-CoA dehydratase 2 [Bison bison bison]
MAVATEARGGAESAGSVFALPQDGGRRGRCPWLRPAASAPPLPRSSLRPLAVASPGGGAYARRVDARHLTWRQRRRLRRLSPGPGTEQVPRHRVCPELEFRDSMGARGRLPRWWFGGPWEDRWAGRTSRSGGLCAGRSCSAESPGGKVAKKPSSRWYLSLPCLSIIILLNFFFFLIALFLRWLVIAVGLVRAYLAKGSYHSLYYSIEKPLKFFQTGALLEILHCAIGIVPSSVVLTSFQVMSRVFLIWAVTHSVKEVQSEDSVLLFVIAWTITEIIRYSFYTFSLLNHLPYLIKWARYTLFIVLYPMGVSGELLTIYAALPFVRQAGLYSISLPNKYNFSFDYYAFLILIMISYIPLFPQLYFHMIHQRRKILSHTEEHKKFE